MALRWKKKPRPQGLMAIGSGPRGSIFHDGKSEYANTAFMQKRKGNKQDGWYWVARNDDAGVPLKNTCDTPLETEDEAKALAAAYVRQCLERAAGVDGA